jgi:hypothetical protein
MASQPNASYAQNKVILYYGKSAGCAQKIYDGRKSPGNCRGSDKITAAVGIEASCRWQGSCQESKEAADKRFENACALETVDMRFENTCAFAMIVVRPEFKSLMQLWLTNEMPESTILCDNLVCARCFQESRRDAMWVENNGAVVFRSPVGTRCG